MRHVIRSLSWVFAGVLLLGLAGCGSPPGPQRSDAPKPQTPQQPAEPGQPAGQAAPAGAGDKDLPAGLAELSGADRAAAEKQRVCPVTGALLGSMGKPYKVTVKGQTVFLCCDGCEQELMQNPDKYLAKLKSAGAK